MTFKSRTVLLAVFLIFSGITIGFQISPAHASDKENAANSAARLQQSLCKLKAHCFNPTEVWPACTGTGGGKYSCVGKFSYYNTSNQCRIDQVHADIAANNSASNAGSSSSACASPNIYADLGTTKNTIPADFVGFSDDAIDILASEKSGNPIFAPSNTSLINLLKLLGPNGYARFGGNSQDVIVSGGVGSGGPLVAGIPPLLTAPIAQHLADFVSALGGGWTLNYGLSGESNDPPANVAKAALVLNAVAGRNPVHFSIGNEPNLWTYEGRPGSPPTSAWSGIFDRYYKALKAYDPSINIVAPELGKFDEKKMMTYINSTTPRLSGLALATVHSYPVDISTIDVPHILSSIGPSPWPKWSGWPNKMRLVESNITSHGGDVTYSPEFVSATWFLEMAIAASSNGWRGVGEHEILTAIGGGVGNGNFRTSYSNCVLQAGPGGPAIPYDPFHPAGSDWYPAPCFYGWYLMSMMEGQTIVGNTTSGVAQDVYVLTTKRSNGNANILIVNGDANPTSITPDQSSPWTTALVYQLADAGGCKGTTPKLNGQAIGAGGTGVAGPRTIHNNSTDLPLTISPCGAAVVQLGASTGTGTGGWCTAWYDTARSAWLTAGSYGPWPTDTCGMGWNCNCPAGWAGANKNKSNGCGTFADGGSSYWWPKGNDHSSGDGTGADCGPAVNNIYCHGRSATVWESTNGCAKPNPAFTNSYH